MGDRSRELPHHRNTVRVRQLHLHVAVTSLAVARLGFRVLALAQVEHESNTLVVFIVECGPAGQHRNATAVLAEELLLEGLENSGRF
jgi:hypothetical protein